jgi:acyl-CoA synthetase (AMP-forming)/AMP-acid ligase II
MKHGLTRKRKRRMPVIVFHGTTDVFPKDVEEIIVQHPAVREAPVFGISNEKWGETAGGLSFGPSLLQADPK